MHVAAGSSAWFADTQRNQDLVVGWTRACQMARCAWGGGETPTLKGVVAEGTVVLSGSAVGIVQPKERLLSPTRIVPGDAIVLLGSSGIHANGLTMARLIAEKLPEGYLTVLPGGRTYGENLLDPTPIYVPVVEDCLRRGIEIHYGVHITGHGWRKLMRAPGAFAYVVDRLPDPLPIFGFLQQHGPVEDAEAYGIFNMGAGFALYMPEFEVRKVWSLLRDEYPNRFTAVLAGHIEHSNERKVVISPLGLEYRSSTPGVR